jgi:glycosyltransferase involved in cell wall biosynthesis
MKIALDITPLSSGHKVRGVGSYTENLIKALKNYDQQNSYIFFTRGEKLPKNIDLVHYPYFEPFFLTLPLRKEFPTVVTVHDLIPLVFPDKFPAGIRGKIKWEIPKFSLKTARVIITDSESSKKDIMRFTGIDDRKIHVVYLAPAPEFRQLAAGSWQLEIRRKHNLPEKFILYVGDATWNKNLPRLIEAAKKIRIPLVMVGKALVESNFDKDNPWNQDLIKVQKLADENKQIIRPGFVLTEDLVALYNLATVFVMSSIYEGFGLPVLEAMACGLPVVTSNTSSLSEICGEAAVMVDPYSINSIAEGIEKVIKDKKIREELIKKGFEQAKKFTWEKTVKETVAVYKKVL